MAPKFGATGLESIHAGLTPVSRTDTNWPLIAGHRSWSVQLAYFPVLAKNELQAADLPEMELSVTLFDNGVSDDLVPDYGDLVLHGT